MLETSSAIAMAPVHGTELSPNRALHPRVMTLGMQHLPCFSQMTTEAFATTNQRAFPDKSGQSGLLNTLVSTKSSCILFCTAPDPCTCSVILRQSTTRVAIGFRSLNLQSLQPKLWAVKSTSCQPTAASSIILSRICSRLTIRRPLSVLQQRRRRSAVEGVSTRHRMCWLTRLIRFNRPPIELTQNSIPNTCTSILCEPSLHLRTAH